MLRTYGSYPQPLLLLKALPEDSGPRSPTSARLPYPERDPARRRQADRRQLRRLLRAQALAGQRRQPRRHRARAEAPKHGHGRLQHGAAAGRAGASPSTRDAGLPDVRRHGACRSLQKSCAYGTCHSSPQADFYLTCGDDDEQRRSTTARRPGSSSRRAYADRAERDPAAAAVAAGRRRQPHGRRVLPVARRRHLEDAARLGDAGAGRRRRSARCVKSAGETFFEDNVMPKLLQRGCALEGCHSPDGFNDFRLRSGAQRLLRAAGAAPQLRGAGGRVHGARHRRRQAVARGEEEHRARARAGSPTAPGRSSRTSAPIDTPCPHAVRSPRRTRAPSACSRSGTASSGTDRRRRRCRRWRRAARCRWRSCRGRRTATTCCSSTPIAGGADLKLADATAGRERRRHRASATCAARWARARAWPARTSTCAAPSGATTAPR